MKIFYMVLCFALEQLKRLHLSLLVPHAIQIYVFPTTDNFDHFKDVNSVIFKDFFWGKIDHYWWSINYGEKYVSSNWKKLRQYSGIEDLPYGGFIVILVEDFQQIPPVGDKLIYTEGNSEASLLFNNVQNFVILKQPQRQVGNSQEELKFQLILQHC